jgi:hypothetical protein
VKHTRTHRKQKLKPRKSVSGYTRMDQIRNAKVRELNMFSLNAKIIKSAILYCRILLHCVAVTFSITFSAYVQLRLLFILLFIANIYNTCFSLTGNGSIGWISLFRCGSLGYVPFAESRYILHPDHKGSTTCNEWKTNGFRRNFYNPKIKRNIRRPQLRWKDQRSIQEGGRDYAWPNTWRW